MKALHNQINQLRNSEKYSVEVDDVIKDLQDELKIAENNLNRFSK